MAAARRVIDRTIAVFPGDPRVGDVESEVTYVTRYVASGVAYPPAGGATGATGYARSYAPIPSGVAVRTYAPIASGAVSVHDEWRLPPKKPEPLPEVTRTRWDLLLDEVKGP